MVWSPGRKGRRKAAYRQSPSDETPNSSRVLGVVDIDVVALGVVVVDIDVVSYCFLLFPIVSYCCSWCRCCCCCSRLRVVVSWFLLVAFVGCWVLMAGVAAGCSWWLLVVVYWLVVVFIVCYCFLLFPIVDCCLCSVFGV